MISQFQQQLKLHIVLVQKQLQRLLQFYFDYNYLDPNVKLQSESYVQEYNYINILDQSYNNNASQKRVASYTQTITRPYTIKLNEGTQIKNQTIYHLLNQNLINDKIKRLSLLIQTLLNEIIISSFKLFADQLKNYKSLLVLNKLYQQIQKSQSVKLKNKWISIIDLTQQRKQDVIIQQSS
ncbi:unnamed protein product [Paramecium sonneborni]|uniref:Uncharacterized protein n=1 Tax=Paramecium sonneborni TaxID=65129 RepID=A0A8S1QMQ1_9CILI|nr:unnamed protein product [Paramecium sonneborni]